MKTISAELFTDVSVTCLHFPKLSATSHIFRLDEYKKMFCVHILIHVHKAVDFVSFVSWLHSFEGSALLKTPHIRIKRP